MSHDTTRLRHLAEVHACLACARTNLKRAHLWTPPMSGMVMDEIHALIKLTDSLKMRIADRIATLQDAQRGKETP